MNRDIDPNQTAFPSALGDQTWGLTKKELFAAIALAGLLANPEFAGEAFEVLMNSAVEAADLLIKKLE